MNELLTDGRFGASRSDRNHHYRFAYKGFQPEGIRSRIRQGQFGPNEIESGAEIHGHIHSQRGQARIGDIVIMRGPNQTEWAVEISGINQNPEMIHQEVASVIGFEIQGTVLTKHSL